MNGRVVGSCERERVDELQLLLSLTLAPGCASIPSFFGTKAFRVFRGQSSELFVWFVCFVGDAFGCGVNRDMEALGQGHRTPDFQ